MELLITTVFDTWVVPSRCLATGNQDEDAVSSALGRDTLSVSYPMSRCPVTIVTDGVSQDGAVVYS